MNVKGVNTMPLPKISIVTPSLNQGHFIEECIKSVVSQDYPDFEHIIIDGGSSDQTVEILKKYSHLIWISEPDNGQSDALNKGFRMAAGEIIGWLNADDKYLPGSFYKVARYMELHPEVDIVYGDYRFIDENGKITQVRKELDFDLFMLKYLHVLYIPSTATFFRIKIIEEKNFLREDFHYAMDYEFFLRLALKGYKFGHLQEILAEFRWHPSSKSSLAAKKQREEQERALQELDPLMVRLSQYPSFVRKMIKQLLMYLARWKRYTIKAIKGYYFSQWLGK
jgi:glycosyltransferase involved in cell wall biosynthesis